MTYDEACKTGASPAVRETTLLAEFNEEMRHRLRLERELAEARAENDRLQHRESICPTMLEAEARALVRCVQECADALGMLPSATPRQLVERAKEVFNKAINAAPGGEPQTHGTTDEQR